MVSGCAHGAVRRHKVAAKERIDSSHDLEHCRHLLCLLNVTNSFWRSVLLYCIGLQNGFQTPMPCRTCSEFRKPSVGSRLKWYLKDCLERNINNNSLPWFVNDTFLFFLLTLFSHHDYQIEK